MGTEKRISKIFPDYFSRFEMPQGAKEQVIQAYRACRSGKCERASFMNSYEENGFTTDPNCEADPSQYSLSLAQQLKDIKRFADMTSDMKIPYAIAKGVTNPEYGLSQRTSERTRGKNSHIDYWLYLDATPWLDFSLIDNFEDYYKKYKEGQINGQ